MKHLFLLAIAKVFLLNFLAAQSDTAVVYYSDYEETTRENADTYIRFYKQDSLWYGKQYFINTGKLKSEGTYSEKQYSKHVGTIKNYSEKGFLKSTEQYNDSSNAIERTYYYENGNKQAWIRYTDAEKNEQKCWDEAGKEQPYCLIEKEARFNGGLEGWRHYLEQNLNANVAADAGAPSGIYTVAVQFIVGKDGMLRKIRPTNVPEKCKPCATEVVRILSNGPKWEPATINGEPVIYQAIQQVSFQVAEEGRKRRKNRD